MSGKPRKRDRLRGFFSRDKRTSQNSDPPSPGFGAAQSIACPQAPPSQAPPSTLGPPVGRQFSEEALLSLASVEQALVRKYAIQDTSNVDDALQQAYEAAIRQKQTYQDKRWRLDFNGRKIVLSDEADRVARWIKRFVSVGDLVANVDPIHIGLPWAGIRLILEVSCAESGQMVALLSGLNLTMYMASRLRAYYAYLTRLPDTDTRLTFEKALVKMYALVLQFLEDAIEPLEKSSLERAWSALWSESSIDEFERKCNSWAMHVAVDVVNCDRELAQRNEEDAREWRDLLQVEVRTLDEGLQDLQTSLRLLHTKHDLAKLVTVPQAVYDSLDEERSARCLPGTRTELLEQILDWASDISGKRIFWLRGMAGTGKSAVARTIAHMLEQQRQLGTSFCVNASFFFKQGEGDRGNAGGFFPTIAKQLADKMPGYGSLIAKALQEDSFLNTKGLQQQFERLISQPLRSLRHGQQVRWNIIVVLDALDECEPRDDILTLLTQLARIGTITSVHLRVFVTSRPELPIQLKFETMSRSLYQDMRLEEVRSTTIEHDIRAYFEHELGHIRSELPQRRPYDDIVVDWPGETSLGKLVELAIPLFIFATTVCRFLKDDVPEYNPRERLDLIIQHQKTMTHSGLEQTYLPILKRVASGIDKQGYDTRIASFQDVVGPIVLLASPLSVPMLSGLLDIHPSDTYERLKGLYSVLRIPKDRNLPIQLLHLSFRDFLIDPDNKDGNPFWVDKAEVHHRLLLHSLRLLGQSRGLRKDICDLRRPGSKRRETDRNHVAKSIPADIAYACSYWVHHLLESGETIDDGGLVFDFLKEHFLHWLEALSWLGKLSDVISHIQSLQLRVQGNAGIALSSFLNDAHRFVLWSRHRIDLAPLQIYSSAMIFAPEKSVMKERFQSQHFMPWLHVLPNVRPRWGAEIQKFEGHTNWVYTVTVSPDSQMLASGSADRTIRLWNSRTGEEIRKLHGHGDGIFAVAFNPHPDQQMLASASRDRTIRLWSTRTGENILVTNQPDLVS